MQKRKYPNSKAVQEKIDIKVDCAMCRNNRLYNNFCWDFSTFNFMWWCIYADYARPTGKWKRESHCKFVKL